MKFIKDNWHWGITIIWIWAIVYLWQYTDFKQPSELNGVGDFLAGAFAPLAFFWLVRGFYQQGEGLKQNSKALTFQVKELSNSTKALDAQVTEQKNLLEATKDQIKINLDKNNFDMFYQKKQLQPFFHIEGLKVVTAHEGNSQYFSHYEISFTLKNSRETCRVIFFTYNFSDDLAADYLFQDKGIEILNKGASEIVKLSLKKKLEFDEKKLCKLLLRISYTDALDQLQHQSLFLYIKNYRDDRIQLDYFVKNEQTLF